VARVDARRIIASEANNLAVNVFFRMCERIREPVGKNVTLAPILPYNEAPIAVAIQGTRPHETTLYAPNVIGNSLF
jgi:hypothetical protein